LIPFHRADREAGEIVITRAVHAGHFRRLATDQRAARLAATFGNAGDDARGGRDIQLSGREIIQENHRLSPLDHQVVDAHGDKVDADGIVDAGGQRDLQFRADPVGRGDHQRVAVTGGGRIEESAEPAQRGIGAGPHGAAGQRLDGLDQFLARVDVDTGGAVVQPFSG